MSIISNVQVKNSLFLLDKVPQYHPKTLAYKEHWSEELKRIREGVWASGKWMPGRLYYYVNYHKILLNKTKTSTQKVFGNPMLRDIEWEFAYHIEEARGFSGFDMDEHFTCLRDYSECYSEQEKEKLRITYPEVYSDTLMSFKIYIEAKDYLKKNHGNVLGIPMYRNQAKNYLFLSSRGIGKSYLLSGLLAHEWLFDGKNPIHKYTAPEDIIGYEKMKTSVILGAGDTRKTGEIMKKVADAVRFLPGKYETSTTTFPSPFYKKYIGNFETEVIATYKKKKGNNWDKAAGSQSKMRALPLGDNPFGGQGDRNNIICFDEVAHFKNPLKSFHALVHNMLLDGVKKFGTWIGCGTGGSADQSNSGNADIQFMFYNPESFDLLTFNDHWENKGKIGYFIPGWMGLNYLRDEEGNIDVEQAKKDLDKDLENARRTKDRASYEKELTYKARVPSEVFLLTDGNIFPVVELKQHLMEIERQGIFDMAEKPVELIYSPTGINGIDFKLLDKGEAQAINQYPWPDSMSNEGSVVIYEFPHVDSETNRVPDDLYVIGHDPFRTDSQKGSYAATVVMKTSKYPHLYGHNEIVAVYYGRPFAGREASNETLLKIAILYNAKVMFENNVGNVKDYFEKKKRLDLLYRRPTAILNNKDSSKVDASSYDYGYPLSNEKVKTEVLQYIKTWLLDERGSENVSRQIVTYDRKGNKKIIEYKETERDQNETRSIRNLNRIWDRRLLQELISYNLEGNFDAVHGLAGAIIAMEEIHKKKTQSLFEKEQSTEFNFLLNNKKLFPRLNTNPSNAVSRF